MSLSNSIKKKPSLRKIKIVVEEVVPEPEQIIQNQKEFCCNQEQSQPQQFTEFFVENDENKNKKIVEYLSTKSQMEIKAMKIAKEHLKSSFNILKSNDYIQWGKQIV
jgi:hypothetical protein